MKGLCMFKNFSLVFKLSITFCTEKVLWKIRIENLSRWAKEMLDLRLSPYFIQRSDAHLIYDDIPLKRSQHQLYKSHASYLIPSKMVLSFFVFHQVLWWIFFFPLIVPKLSIVFLLWFHNKRIDKNNATPFNVNKVDMIYRVDCKRCQNPGASYTKHSD